jgi:hypothetical protein
VHKFQDRVYGKDNRIHNSRLKGYRCTVCLNERRDTVNPIQKGKEND